ncbi:hypothetical protein ACTXG6_39615 [Pseudonocardia sp. Cha107L01]|jgi:hypothetical protein|uniref:hypothetical protein n=1 Tax=Pseudonocardia sp. Cha107L01 TaxID=3457576 RepID=UPI00403EAC3C
MTERTLVLCRLPTSQLPADLFDLKVVQFPNEVDPTLVEYSGADQRVTSHTVTVLPDGDLLLSLWVERNNT